VTEILYGLHGERRERVAALRKRGEFFWLDASLSETDLDDLVDALDIPERASQVLVGYGEAYDPSRKFHADGQHVIFVSTCYLEPAEGLAEATHRLRPVEVHVLVSGEYLLTLHQERMSLPGVLAPDLPQGRSRKYVVYSVLDSMVATAFDALNDFDMVLDDLAMQSTEMRGGRVQMATLRKMISGLAGMRRRASPQGGLFERIGMEIGRLPGLQADEERYFDRLGNRVNRLVDAINAAGDDMATVIDLRLNETSYLLTVVATIFLPLTFVTGFFGMNFDWMIARIDTQLAFWLLGVGLCIMAVLLAWRLIVVRGSPIEVDREAEDAANSSPETWRAR
jgi:magnesium transporter